MCSLLTPRLLHPRTKAPPPTRHAEHKKSLSSNGAAEDLKSGAVGALPDLGGVGSRDRRAEWSAEAGAMCALTAQLQKNPRRLQWPSIRRRPTLQTQTRNLKLDFLSASLTVQQVKGPGFYILFLIKISSTLRGIMTKKTLFSSRKSHVSLSWLWQKRWFSDSCEMWRCFADKRQKMWIKVRFISRFSHVFGFS